MEKTRRQRVQYLRTEDGIRLAWADVGTGPVLAKAGNWLTHLEYDLESPVWRHWIRFFADRFRFLRYDERGCGMTDRDVPDFSPVPWVEDLEAVVDAAAPDGPIALLGISQGAATCIQYALRHPERVSHLVLYGGYARGWAKRDSPAAELEYRAITDIVRAGWGRENPTFRQLFTSRFIPGASREQTDWFNELCARTTTGEIAARLIEARGQVDVTALLSQVRTPTLVLHARDDVVAPIAEGRLLASEIPNAEFVELESKNHILLESDPGWARFQDAVLAFLGMEERAKGRDGAEDPAFAALSAREREVLGLITRGLGNAVIAESLSISEKTVRNHVSNVFDKLGVWTRAQAIVFARDRGFKADS
jgi:pimeloyl-ACP methyl ester carboxylesterase/DNA-binding CsgD family transcriptional regulator